MNNSRGEAEPKFEFPTLSPAQEAAAEQAMEKAVREEDSLGKHKSPQIDLTASPSAPPVVAIPVFTAEDDSPKGATSRDLPAADLDRIEREWVDRAKAIVSQTKSDPYSQKKEISKAGADYRKKRFNKSIPTDDAVRA